MTYEDLVASLEKSLDDIWSGRRAGEVVLQTLRNLDEEAFVSVLRTMPPSHFRQFVSFVGEDLELLLTDFLTIEVFHIE